MDWTNGPLDYFLDYFLDHFLDHFLNPFLSKSNIQGVMGRYFLHLWGQGGWKLVT